jgi:hypothetical protein
MMTRRLALAALASLVTAPAFAGDAVTVRADGTLETSAGPWALAGLRQPFALGNRWQALQQSCVSALQTLLAGEAVMLHPRARDRWGRTTGDLLLSSGRPLEAALIETGWAVYEDDGGDAARRTLLLSAEGKARAANAGLWGAGYRVYRSAESFPIGDFVIVAGRVMDAQKVGSRIFLNFGADWKSDFTALIEGDARRTFRRGKVDPLAWKGAYLRLRGIAETWNGPLVRLLSPGDVEILEGDEA